MADLFNIAGRINSTSAEHVVSTTNLIKDETIGKYLDVINQEVSDAIDQLEQREPGVQSDWNESDSTELSYINNKPTFKTINSESILGQGDIVISGGSGGETTADKVTDTRLNKKQDVINEEFEDALDAIGDQFDNYYTKTQTYSKPEVDALIPQIMIQKITLAGYDALQTKDTNTLYVIEDV